MYCRRVVVFSVLLLSSHSLQLQAIATSIWDGGGSNDNWSTALNWANDAAPSNDGLADVNMTGATRLTPYVDLPWNIHSLTFDSNASTFTLNSSSLTIQAGGVTRLGTRSARHLLTGQFILGADQTWNTGNGYIYLDSSGSLNMNGHVLNVTGEGMQFLGAITGSGSIVISTSEYVCLWGDNTFSDGVVINQGTLNIVSASGLGAAGSPVTINGGVLQIQSSSVTINRDITLGLNGGAIYTTGETVTIPGSICGSGHLSVHGGSILNLTGTNSYSGGTTLCTSARVTGTTNSIQGNISANVFLSCAVLKFQQDFNGIFSGDIDGYMLFRKEGTGSVTLSGYNTYTAGTDIREGMLVINGENTGSGMVTVDAGAALSGHGIIGGPVSIAGTLAPGNGIGIMTVNNQVTFQAGSLFDVEVSGLTAGSGYDQLVTTGPVSLDGWLDISFGSFTPTGDDMLFLIDNTGVDPTTGTFQYADDALIGSFGGFDWFITYDADNGALPNLDGGNDVAIYCSAVPEPGMLALLAAGLVGLLVFVRRKR